jgi:hypothetical protein
VLKRLHLQSSIRQHALKAKTKHTPDSFSRARSRT